jgi:hypothetical protein
MLTTWRARSAVKDSPFRVIMVGSSITSLASRLAGERLSVQGHHGRQGVGSPAPALVLCCLPRISEAVIRPSSEPQPSLLFLDVVEEQDPPGRKLDSYGPVAGP